MRYVHVGLEAFGYELPPHRVSSDDLEARLGEVYERLNLPQGRLELMSGIKERRFWDRGMRPSQGAVLAGQKALANAHADPGEIECLIFASVSRDMMEPATASFVHGALKLNPDCQVFDLSNACLGFLNGMVMLANMIELGQVKKGLIVAGETAEDLVETTIEHLLGDRSLTRKSIKGSFASLTIGSGAVALVMAKADQDQGGHFLCGGVCRANTSQSHLCQGGQESAGTLMQTDSEELLKRGVETAQAAWKRFLPELDWPAESIDHFFCHQVGRAHAKLLFETLCLDPAKNYQTLSSLGNVGSVSAPITMAMAIEKGLLKTGQRSALLGIGSGINSMMLGILW